MRTPLVRALPGLSLVLLLATAACSDGPTGPDPADFPGTYVMEAYVGLDLPVLAVLPDGSSFIVESGEMQVNADGTGAFRAVIRTNAGAQPVEDPVTWQLDGTVVRMDFPGDVEGIGDWEDDTLALTILGGVYRFRR